MECVYIEREDIGKTAKGLVTDVIAHCQDLELR